MRSLPIFNIVLVVIVIGLLFVVVFYSYNVFFSQKTTNPVPNQDSINIQSEEASAQALYDDNSEIGLFRSGASSLERGEMSTARSFFDKSLTEQSDALSIEQKAHIEYLTALTYVNDDPIKSIELMKELVANPDYPSQQKAYAIQHLYTMWRMYTTNMNKEAFDTIMSGTPYSSFLVEGDQLSSMANLNEFAVSLGSAPYSEIELAAHNASQLSNENLSSNQKTSYLLDIIATIDSVESYLIRNENIKPNAALKPRITQGLSKVYGILARLNEEPFLSEFPRRFEEAISSNPSDAQRLIIGMDYAWTAGLVGDDEMKKDSQAMLSSLILEPEKYPALVYWFVSRDDKTEDQENMLEFLIDSNSDFKSMLETVGYFDNA
jgi:hypothetical protein